MNLRDALMEQTLLYRLWQAPFATKKFAPVLARNDLRRARRVLDVGCGPGASTTYFKHAEYVGIDINEGYIRDARRQYGRDFRVVDITKYTAAPDERYDFILVNSFLHHLDTPDVMRILSHLSRLLTPDGHVHILELVLPGGASLARLLARCDRGKFPRPLADWRQLFDDIFERVIFEPYAVMHLGVTSLQMVYFKGRTKR